MNTANSNVAMPPSRMPKPILADNQNMELFSFTPKENKLYILAWSCARGGMDSEGFPTIDYKKFAELAGLDSVTSAVSSCAELKLKLLNIDVQPTVEPISNPMIDDNENFDIALEQRTPEGLRTDGVGVPPVVKEENIVNTVAERNSEHEDEDFLDVETDLDQATLAIVIVFVQ